MMSLLGLRLLLRVRFDDYLIMMLWCLFGTVSLRCDLLWLTDCVLIIYYEIMHFEGKKSIVSKHTDLKMQ
jgi:hypothetical protein